HSEGHVRRSEKAAATIQAFTLRTIRYNDGALSTRAQFSSHPLVMMPSPFASIVDLLVLSSCVCPGLAAAQPPAEQATPPRLDRDQRPIEYWLEQLDSDQFSHRQLASRQLNRLGDEAVAPLVQAAQSAKLELTQRALGI